MDFIDELGELAIGSRLKRLGDRMVSEASAVYAEGGVAFEPRWFPLLALLHRHGPIGVVDASRRLGVTQPAVSQFARQLEGRGLVVSAADPLDGRRKLLSLSPQGHEQVAAMAPMWTTVEEVAIDLCYATGVDFLGSMRRFEAALGEASLAERVGRAAASDVRIVPYRPEHQAVFYAVNREWLEAMFAVEPVDLENLEHPKEHILQDGGQIWLAESAELGVVGTCALKRTGPGELELTKFGVSRAARGRRVGARLLRRVIHEAHRVGTHQLYLLTAARCEAAVHLFEAHGFVHSTEVMQRYGKRYARCDVAMVHRG